MSGTQVPPRLCNCLKIKSRLSSRAFKSPTPVDSSPKVTLTYFSNHLFPQILCCKIPIASSEVPRDVFIARSQSIVLREASAPPAPGTCPPGLLSSGLPALPPTPPRSWFSLNSSSTGVISFSSSSSVFCPFNPGVVIITAILAALASLGSFSGPWSFGSPA